MGFPKWLVGGLIGTTIGVAVWVAVGFFLEREIGYIAWAIGLLAGIGVRTAAPLDSGVLPGGTALICAVVGVVAAKLLVVTLLMDHAMADGGFAESMGGATKGVAFKDSFSPFDFLWVGLAAITAFKVGNGKN